jgi:hypothetical protein
MAKQVKKETNSTMVNHNITTLNKVRKNKEKTGVPVATFYDLAAEEKLKTKKL